MHYVLMSSCPFDDFSVQFYCRLQERYIKFQNNLQQKTWNCLLIALGLAYFSRPEKCKLKSTKLFPNSSCIAENLNEVLDAMFHREVTEGENIITQGDDGDNFYVIERHVHDSWYLIALLPWYSLVLVCLHYQCWPMRESEHYITGMNNQWPVSFWGQATNKYQWVPRQKCNKISAILSSQAASSSLRSLPFLAEIL